MMKKTFIILLAFLLVACIFQPSFFNIEGTIYYKGEPVADCIVQFDSSSIYSDVTNENGQFKINGLTQGKHDVYIHKNLDSNMYVGLSKVVRIGSDTSFMENIELYEPLKLMEFNRNETKNEKLKLQWNNKNDSNIVGYKIISNQNIFFDEANTRVVYESTNPNDSVYYDYGFNDDEPTHYQLFTYYKDGKFGVGNIVSIIANKVTFILNGGFEEEMNYNNWYMTSTYADKFIQDSVNAYEGEKCLVGRSSFNSASYIGQYVPIGNFLPGRRYRFSLMMKSGENTTLSAPFSFNAPFGVTLPTLSLAPSQDWTRKSVDFIMPHLEPTFLTFQLVVKSSGSEGIGWFDDVRLELLGD